MSSRSRLVVLLISGPVIAFALIGGALSNASARDDSYQPLRMFQDVVSLIVSNYVEKVDVDHVMDGAMRGLADGLDSDSAYLTPDEVKAVEAGTPLAPAGIGVTITRQYYLRIVAARDGSPAAQGGLRTGDYIRDIDGKPTREMSVWEGVRALRGEPGSKVTLTIIRGNAADPHDISLTRAVESGPAVTGRIASPGVGYLRIDDFDNDVAAQVAREVAQLQKAGATRLAIDVRRSASGALANGLAVARLFVKSGTLALEQSRETPQKTIGAEAGDGRLTLPVILMVDDGTAGPAELFAAALAGNHRAQLVGERTEGHGAIQTLVRLQNGAGLWLSTTQYLTPAGAVIEDRGLAPDVAVAEPRVDFGEIPPSTDPILDKALALLSSDHAA
ncbi:MAG: S41 family peptidase [Acidobacteriota bacterium]|nr:S41 family peptidase [Acidobacteriota bacterium]